MTKNKQQATYRIKVVGHKLTVSGKLVESHAFRYGNGTGVELTVDYNGKREVEFLDTRYATGITKNFAGWLKTYIKETWPAADNEIELVND